MDYSASIKLLWVVITTICLWTAIVDSVCPRGRFGWNCQLDCGNCADDACDPEKPICLNGCKPGYYGSHCLFDDTCYYHSARYYNGSISVTESGKPCKPWKENPTSVEPDNFCRTGDMQRPWCYPVNGTRFEFCDIKDCKTCPPFLHGDGCLSECHCKDNTQCDTNGICAEKGCADGWLGSACDKPCDKGYYGRYCQSQCTSCFGEDCDPETGHCRQGCEKGFQGPKCQQECNSMYGRNCMRHCGQCLKGKPCDRITGHCRDGCDAGYNSSHHTLQLCDKECSGRYGKNCAERCGLCLSGQCDIITGHCLSGCKAGFNPPMCQEGCRSHFFGKDCANRCGECRNNDSCDPFTGGCISGCGPGFTGFTCLERIKEDGNAAALAIYGTIGTVIVAIILLVLLCILYKKKRHKNLNVSKTRVVEYVDDHMTRGESCQLLGDSRVGSEPPSFVREEEDNHKNESTEPIYVNVTNRKQSQPVPVPQLYEYIRKNKERSWEGFKKEFEELPMGLLAQCDIARKPENKNKNRYGNIIAYDHSRVILDPLPNENFSDYVNANFMDGYGRKNYYIASQGPNKVMIKDFWRMVWQHRVSKIVMLTNLVESCKKKCEQYWPEEGSQKYGDLSVLLVNTTKYSDFVIRTFELSKENENSRIVKQFHFTTWSDHGAPTYPTTLLAFRRKVINFKPDDTAPVLSHCSAGIGRTGTFIALNYLLEQAQAEGVVDVLRCAQQMRGNRVNMIQTLEQYVFVYDAVLEAILAAVTTIPRSNFHAKYEEMLNQEGMEETQMERQHNVLQQLSPTIEREECSSALQEDNMAKNRFKNILPANRNRPFLLTQMDGCNDYINAVYLSSYTQKDQFIITQMPLPTTVSDFWRMMNDTCSDTIVMLNEFDRNDKSCALYWPEEYGYCETYGPLSVELLSSSDVDPDVTIRVFKLSHSTKGEERAIKQFMLKSWTDYQTTPSSTTPLIRLHRLVTDWLKQISKGPVTIHCMNGASKSGVLVATCLLLERLELDYEVDVYQTVKQIRISRPQFIENLEQYKFLYKIVQDYLDQD